MVVGRLAPTPSGRLHLGNALAFGVAWLSARQAQGKLLLRVEDGDPDRSRAEVLDALHGDLDWLGLTYDEEVAAQSTRDYRSFVAMLDTYRCTCSRRELRERPCPCSALDHVEGAIRWRLPPGAVAFVDRRFGPQRVDPGPHGDPTLVNRVGVDSYLLRVVVDDLRDGVTEVVRGADLLDFTAVQILLWRALGATPPTWLHAPLLLGSDGRKLSKSHASTEIGALREAGVSAAQIWAELLPLLGIHGVDTLHDAVHSFQCAGGTLGPTEFDERRLW